MPSSQFTYALPFGAPRPVVREEQVEYGFIGKLQSLKYDYRTDIRDRAALERNFREKFEALNRVHLSDGEFARLLDEIVTPDVFAAARTLRSINAFTRDDGTPLNYTLVNIKDWCKNTFEVVNQLRINTDYSHHRYDVLILINGVPCVQIELKTLGISPRRAMEQIVDYKNDLGNGYSKTLLCFLQLFIVSNRTETHYFANNNARHFAFNADERFLPIYQFADEANKKITHLDHFAETFLPKCALGELSEFDLYYQDVQKRIKDQQWPNADFPAAKKIDITIVVDMLLTGFDSKYLNTLYVDKNLKYHGLIQAFSRTNRVLNGSKPYGNILDFRQQQDNVDAAIALFSGENATQQDREIWLVDKAPVVIDKLDAAVQKLADFMQTQGLACAPEAVPQLKGDDARAAFIKAFKEVQRLKTQLDQYTDLTPDNAAAIEAILPREDLQAFRGVYLDTAQRLKAQQGKGAQDADGPGTGEVDQLDFEFVLFASAVIDYDYIMGLMARFSQQGAGTKQKMTKDELVGLILADAKFMNERDDIAAYINTLKAGEGLSEAAIREGYTRFKREKDSTELTAIATRHQLAPAALQAFVDGILQRMIFDGEALSDLMAPLDLGWKARAQAELALMKELVPLLHKRVQGRDISGLSAYE
jgi:type I restriction enzyme R subunit